MLVNLCLKLLFLHQLTHNMTTDCSLKYKFNTWKFQAQTWGDHVVYRNCFWHSEQFLYTNVLPIFCKKKSFLRKIYVPVSVCKYIFKKDFQYLYSKTIHPIFFPRIFSASKIRYQKTSDSSKRSSEMLRFVTN